MCSAGATDSTHMGNASLYSEAMDSTDMGCACVCVCNEEATVNMDMVTLIPGS